MYRHDPSHTGYSLSEAPNTNRTFWTRHFDDWVRSSPAVHNNVVFIGADDGLSEGKLYALNATTGEEIWSFVTGGDVVSSAAVADGHVYFGCEDGNLYCLDEAEGDLLWSFQTGGIISSSPCVTQNKVLFGSDDFRLYCLDASEGLHLWNYSTLGPINSSPAVSEGRVFFGSHDREVYALDLATGGCDWRHKTTASITVSPAIAGGDVFISSFKTVLCFRASDGDPIWNYTTGGVIHTSPAVSDGSIYFGCNDDQLYCIDASNGQSTWNFTTGGDIHSSPAVADGKVFFGSNDNRAYCVNATSGNLIWNYNTGGMIRTSSPAIANKVVFVASSYYPPFSGKLFAFGPANKPPLAANLTITPSSPYTTEDLIASYDYSDPDGDPESGTEIRWYRNDLLQPVYNDTLTIPSAATSKEETWHFTVKPKDGKELGTLKMSQTVNVQNSPPRIDSVTIDPDPSYTNETLTASPVGWADADGDSEGYSFQWQKHDGETWQNIAGATTETLNSENFLKGDLIRILCTPYDGADFGSTKGANTTISNSPPTISTHYPQFEPVIIEGRTQEFNITKYDIDFDQLTVEWFVNGTKVLEGSDSYVYFADFESAGDHNVTVAVSDGTDQTKQQWSLTVTDIPRDVAVVHMELYKTIIGQGYSLNINITVENQGDYTESFNVTLRANSTLVDMKQVNLASNASTLVTFAWSTGSSEKGNYSLNATAIAVPGEMDTIDNMLIYSDVCVTIPGDVDGDHDVDILDVVKITGTYSYRIGDLLFNPNADIDGDGEITILDVVMCTSHYSQKF